jgi:folate-binding protein YgfZ
MTTPLCIRLANRGVLRIQGEDARTFLQGLISNDVMQVSPTHAAWAAFLTPQGRYLHDFFLVAQAGTLLLEGEAERLVDLRRRLLIYKLRSRVTIEAPGDAMSVWSLIGDDAAARCGLVSADIGRAVDLDQGIAFVDPRLAAAGVRAILPSEDAEQTLSRRGFDPGSPQVYDRIRISHGLPDGSRDLLVEKSLLLECGFDELHGIDWGKGCFLGQELTARTRYRGLIKRRLIPVSAEGPLPASGTPVTRDGRDVGEIRSGTDGMALALLRLDALDLSEGVMRAGEARLRAHPPEWMSLPPS